MKNETKEMLIALGDFARERGFGTPVVCFDYPIEAAVRLASDNLVIDFIYGPPEFLVSMALRDPLEPNSHAVSLGELFAAPGVRKWVEVHRWKHVDCKPTITEQVHWYCQLLAETCGELFTDSGKFMQSTGDKNHRTKRRQQIASRCCATLPLCKEMFCGTERIHQRNTCADRCRRRSRSN